jgi:drug/metabolite transporter (DMT)-like permease
MQSIDRRQAAILVILTLVWGFNWPVMKLGLADYPPLTFRALSMVGGVPVLALALVALKIPFRLPRRHWPELARLTLTNMFIWHICIIVALKSLASGRAAILGYTMPIFSAVIGALFFSAALSARAWSGVAAAAVGVVLLLWHEFANLGGHPVAASVVLCSAAIWALGTQLLRRTRIDVSTLTLSFWMTAITACGLTLIAAVVEGSQWRMPGEATWWSIGYNAVLIFGFAHAAWFSLARSLPPVASTISVMFIPVLATFSGAWALSEVLHWQDWAAMVLIVVAIAAVLWPAPRKT